MLDVCAQAKSETHHIPTDSWAELPKIPLRTPRSLYGHAQSNKRRLCFWMLYRFLKNDGLQFGKTFGSRGVSTDVQERFHFRPWLSEVMACYRHKASLLAVVPEMDKNFCCTRTLKSFSVKLNRYIYKLYLLYGYMLLAPPMFPNMHRCWHRWKF